MKVTVEGIPLEIFDIFVASTSFDYFKVSSVFLIDVGDDYLSLFGQ